jgi:hypothetical protein
MLLKKRDDSLRLQLARQKRVFQMRERAEVLAAHPELQQPWEKLASFPPPLPPPSSLHRQISALSSRFRKPDRAEDLWDPRDGPSLSGANGEGRKDPPKEDFSELLPFNMRKSVSASTPSLSSSSSSCSSSPLDRRKSVCAKGKKGNEVSPIGKSMQDYLDSFETDPLGLSTEREKGAKGKGRR